jgi:hypothetical protein
MPWTAKEECTVLFTCCADETAAAENGHGIVILEPRRKSDRTHFYCDLRPTTQLVFSGIGLATEPPYE